MPGAISPLRIPVRRPEQDLVAEDSPLDGWEVRQDAHGLSVSVRRRRLDSPGRQNLDCRQSTCSLTGPSIGRTRFRCASAGPPDDRSARGTPRAARLSRGRPLRYRHADLRMDPFRFRRRVRGRQRGGLPAATAALARPRRRVRGQHRDDRARRPDRGAGDDRSDGPPAGGPPGWRARDGRRRRARRQPPRRGGQRDDEHRGHRRRLTGPAALVPALQLGRPGCPGRRHRPGRGRRCPGHRAPGQHGGRRQPHLPADRLPAAGRRPSSPTSTARPRTPARTPGSTSPGSARSPRCRSCPRGS